MKKEEINRICHMILNNYYEILKIYVEDITFDAIDFIKLSNFAIDLERPETVEFLRKHFESKMKNLNKGNRITKINGKDKK